MEMLPTEDSIRTDCCLPHVFLLHDGCLCIDRKGDRWRPATRLHAMHIARAMEFDWLDGSKCRAVEVDEEGDGIWIPLRQCFGQISLDDYRKASKAVELLDWDRNTRFCGCCGSPLELVTPISKYCDHCHTEQWPRLSPAIIVLISRKDEILLVQSRTFKRDYYGLVSGFVELGETLEECLYREVMEETGMRVSGVRYAGSQAWPFPRNLMVGFYATWESGELQLQNEELKKGGWFRYDRLPPIPDKPSIARRLIDDWRASFL